MRAAVLFVGLTACGFQYGQLPDAGDGDGAGDDARDCVWSYVPTNFDPCKLPAPVGLSVSTDDTIDTDATTLPKLVITQSDGTTITVIHLSELSIAPLAMLTVTGTGVVFAVDGTADIAGRITVAGGSDNATHCTTARGTAGTDSQDITGGGGGGGGGGAADDGGDGGDGAGIDAGAKGAKGSKVQSSLSPLRGGCRGGNGGRIGSSQAAAGGRGGGALQISTNTKIAVAGMLDAAGRGGEGGTAAHVGGGGGGSGGAILLEGPAIELGFASRICADGGSGGEGGGVTVEGKDGERGACTSLGPARTATTQNSAGGGGGEGGFLVSPSGSSGEVASSSGGGGGGGGGVGWIVFKSPSVGNQGAAVTPAPED